MDSSKIPGIDPDIPTNAVSIYGQGDAAEEFPVLKAFQQYIDAEQEKSRKRMIALSAFFAFVLVAVISVFVIFLMNISSRNQQLNDRLVEYAMKDRERQQVAAQPVVVQPPQDSSALMAVTAKLDELQKKMAQNSERERVELEKAKAEAETRAKGQSRRQTEEIEQLKALLAAEKEKNAIEAKKKREAELDAYRRKHYPELYVSDDEDEGPVPVRVRVRRRRQSLSKKKLQLEDKAADAEIEDILNDSKAISYFDEGDETEAKSPSRSSRKTRSGDTENYTIPVDVKKSGGVSWSIPME